MLLSMVLTFTLPYSIVEIKTVILAMFPMKHGDWLQVKTSPSELEKYVDINSHELKLYRFVLKIYVFLVIFINVFYSYVD